MNRSKIVALLVVVASCAWCGVASAQAPTCSTFDLGGRAATGLRSGSEFVLKGAGFPANILVLVTFRQPTQVVEMARFKTDGNGDFTNQPTILRIPAEAVAGTGAIRVVSSEGSATCNVDVVASGAARPATVTSGEPGDSEGDLSPWFVVWAALLALGAACLGYVRYRRWQQDRLAHEMSALGGGAGRGGPPLVVKPQQKSRPPVLHHATQRRPEPKRRRLGDVVEGPPPPLPPNE